MAELKFGDVVEVRMLNPEDNFTAEFIEVSAEMPGWYAFKGMGWVPAAAIDKMKVQGSFMAEEDTGAGVRRTVEELNDYMNRKSREVPHYATGGFIPTPTMADVERADKTAELVKAMVDALVSNNIHQSECRLRWWKPSEWSGLVDDRPDCTCAWEGLA